jgi:hypothetical protein
MWIKRIVNQAIRGSFECYLNVDKEVSRLDHVTEENEDISNLDDSINLNLWALNEEMDFDVKIKEKISIMEWKLVNGKLIIPKHFITLPYVDRDIVLEKNVVRSINHILETVELNIVVELENEEKPDPDLNDEVLVVHIDDSYSSEVDDDDADSEAVGDNSIFYHDGAESDQLEYVKNLCISLSSESAVMAGKNSKIKP